MAYKIRQLILLTILPLVSFSQEINQANIGDHFPLLKFDNLFNQQDSSLYFSDLKGKLVIIDFWNTSCGTCIEAFPKMEKIQNHFGEQVKILLVTSEKDDKVSKLFKRIKKPFLTMLTNDSILSKMFPHITVPHHVWINPDGHIQFITDGYNATIENVEKVLNKTSFNLNLKKELDGIDLDADLWKEGGGRFQKYITNYSFVMPYLKENWHNGMSFNKDILNKTCGFKLVNTRLIDIYRIAFSGVLDYTRSVFAQDNRILFNSKKAQSFFEFPKNTDSIPEWINRNLVCYESKWKIKDDSLAFKFLQDDVNRFFPFSVNILSIKMPCYVLKKASNFNFKNLGLKERVEYTDSTYKLINKPLKNIIESLNGLEIFKNYPVIDETEFTLNYSLSLINAFSNIKILQKQLLDNGLILERSLRVLPMLVIGDK